MSSLALTSSWYYICTSYYTSDRYKFTKSRDNFNKDGKSRYFYYNIYKHIAKNCWKLKKKKVSKKMLQV